MPRSGWGFDSPSPHQLTSRAGSLVRTAVCKTAEPGPIPGRLSTLSDCPRRPKEGRPSSKRLRCGFESRRGLSLDAHSPCPHRLAGQGLRVLTPATRVRIPLGTPTAWVSPGSFVDIMHPHRGVAQPGKSACLGDRRSPVRIRPPRPRPKTVWSVQHCRPTAGRRFREPYVRVRLPSLHIL